MSLVLSTAGIAMKYIVRLVQDFAMRLSSVTELSICLELHLQFVRAARERMENEKSGFQQSVVTSSIIEAVKARRIIMKKITPYDHT